MFLHLCVFLFLCIHYLSWSVKTICIFDISLMNLFKIGHLSSTGDFKRTCFIKFAYFISFHKSLKKGFQELSNDMSSNSFFSFSFDWLKLSPSWCLFLFKPQIYVKWCKIIRSLNWKTLYNVCFFFEDVWDECWNKLNDEIDH